MKIEWRLASFVERGCNSQGVGCGWETSCARSYVVIRRFGCAVNGDARKREAI